MDKFEDLNGRFVSLGTDDTATQVQGLVMDITFVIKSACLDNHLADLRLALERMCLYGLKMNPHKCAFGVSAGKFLGFIIHEKGIEIDPKRIEAMRKVETPCKKDL